VASNRAAEDALGEARRVEADQERVVDEADTPPPPEVVPLLIAGYELPLRVFTSEAGNVCYVLAAGSKGRAMMYGERIDALAEELPDHVSVGGVRIELEPGTTRNGTPRVSGHGRVPVAAYELVAQVVVSEVSRGGWNVIAKLLPRPKGRRQRSTTPLNRF
jgi:hypothetical protein